MLRLVIYFLVVAGLASVLSWLADNPGSIVVNWQGYIWDTNVFQMTIILSVLAAVVVVLWTALRSIWQSPAAIGNFFNRRREKRGLEALSSGMIAIGAGDRALATRYAIQARKSLPNEPMTHLLRAQAAQLADDRTTSRRIFEAMLAAPDTEALGLRGLYLEAEREGEKEAARQFAERAVKLNPKLSWPVDALFEIQCRSADWQGALETLGVARKHGHIEKQAADRRRAVLLAGQAQEAEDSDPERAMNLALEAHNLAPDLVPAAAVAGRLLSARGSTPRATKVLQKTWRKSPHPDLAVAYAYARLGDSPRDRLQRLKELTGLTPNQLESPIALANAAIEAREFDVARDALQPLTEGRLTQRVCTLMARIEGEQSGNAGAVREWLARAVNAPRDPAWTADGIVSDTWQPISPITGALDAFQWRVPVEAAEPGSKELLAQKIEELVKLGGGGDAMIAAGPADVVERANETLAKADASNDVETVDAEAVEVKMPAPVDDAQASLAESDAENSGTAKSSAGTEGIAADKGLLETAGEPTAVDDRPSQARVEDAEAHPAQSDTSRQERPEQGAEVAGVVATEPEGETGSIDPSPDPEQGKAAARSAQTEPRIFVPPRAPDDPGPDAADQSGSDKARQFMPFQPAKS